MGVFEFLIVKFGKNFSVTVIDCYKQETSWKCVKGSLLLSHLLNLDGCWRIASDLLGAGSEAMLLGRCG